MVITQGYPRWAHIMATADYEKKKEKQLNERDVYMIYCAPMQVK